MAMAAVTLVSVVAAVPASQAADAPTYVVGSGGTYRPFEFETAQKELVGFDIDVIKAIGR
ncbi:transporter substrate-binding domain-containing protein, partial [Pandoraea terrae]|uniref:transporter substrate-binding domain-containing protein n=1 Tax=Pandoraea terrae TaxID=1537710 RepID=UPI001CD2740D